MEQEIRLCDVVETAREFTYLGDRVSDDGVYEAAVTARTIIIIMVISWCYFSREHVALS